MQIRLVQLISDNLSIEFDNYSIASMSVRFTSMIFDDFFDFFDDLSILSIDVCDDLSRFITRAARLVL